MSIVKKFGVDFGVDVKRNEGIYGRLACTLPAHDVSEVDLFDRGEVSAPNCEDGRHSRTHSDGWTITGYICEDWYLWVNEFDAIHPTYGRVHGNYETEVYADSEEAFNHFYQHHPPKVWDYWDI
jgi:hypothetical protein